MIALLPELEDLETAEAFLDHFAVDYDRARLQPLRVPMLRRFHRYLAAAAPGEGIAAQRTAIRACLVRAYQDVVEGAAVAASPAAAVASQGERTFIPLAALVPISDSR
jgi:nitrogenase-stabilizing/protective protein